MKPADRLDKLKSYARNLLATPFDQRDYVATEIIAVLESLVDRVDELPLRLDALELRLDAVREPAPRCDMCGFALPLHHTLCLEHLKNSETSGLEADAPPSVGQPDALAGTANAAASSPPAEARESRGPSSLLAVALELRELRIELGGAAENIGDAVLTLVSAVEHAFAFVGPRHKTTRRKVPSEGGESEAAAPADGLVPPEQPPPFRDKLHEFQHALGRLEADLRGMRSVLRAKDGEGNLACAVRAACLAYPTPPTEGA